MRDAKERQVGAVRRLLSEARADNSRMVAAAIGAHLSGLTRDSAAPELQGASDVVRDASLHLLKAIHRSDGIARARTAALKSVDGLEAALPGQGDAASAPPTARTGPLRRLALRTIPALRAVRHS